MRTRHLSEELDDLLKSLHNMGKAAKKIRRERELPSLAIINKIMGEHAGSIRAITVCIDLELKKSKIMRERELPSLAIINKIMGEHAGSIRAITACIDLELKKSMEGER
jgi:hypothetical protein